jgi:hypothetical protein
MRWGRLVTGLVLAVVSGLVLGGVWATGDGLRWWAGGLTLLAGVLFSLSALYAPRETPTVLPSARPREPLQKRAAVPLIGEMLVSRTIISRDHLRKALESQRGSRMRLGEILVQMRVITRDELGHVLDDQLAVRNGAVLWRDAR